jgi:hypothetical protein
MHCRAWPTPSATDLRGNLSWCLISGDLDPRFSELEPGAERPGRARWPPWQRCQGRPTRGSWLLACPCPRRVASRRVSRGIARLKSWRAMPARSPRRAARASRDSSGVRGTAPLASPSASDGSSPRAFEDLASGDRSPRTAYRRASPICGRGLTRRATCVREVARIRPAASSGTPIDAAARPPTAAVLAAARRSRATAVGGDVGGAMAARRETRAALRSRSQRAVELRARAMTQAESRRNPPASTITLNMPVPSVQPRSFRLPVVRNASRRSRRLGRAARRCGAARHQPL